MLNLSKQKIPLGKSSYYARFVLFIYASAAFLLLNSACCLALKLLIVFFLLVNLFQILNNPVPYPDYLMLSYHQDGWFIHAQNEQDIFYEKGEIVIDTGLFFLLRLTLGKRHKYLVIFFDQLDNLSYRLLRIQQKIN
ncbi:MAG: hypothetical protein H0U73_00055 [Tatlockia sp.]|nr:hypothetical protein [Tatlockia sp.]